MKQAKEIEEKGEVDYDFKNDILFFKAKDREYDRSIESNNIVLDIDTKGNITGLQIFEASKFLNIDKIKLKDIPHWKFNTRTEKIEIEGKEITKIEIRLVFKVRVRNQLIEKNPIIIQPLAEVLPDTELVCVA